MTVHYQMEVDMGLRAYTVRYYRAGRTVLTTLMATSYEDALQRLFPRAKQCRWWHTTDDSYDVYSVDGQLVKVYNFSNV